MKKHSLLFFLLSLTITSSFAQATFQKRYGGHRGEKMTGLARTHDGGYVLAGGSGSFGDTLGDAYLVKTDSTGNLLWSMIYHGALNDYCNKVIETADHGLLLIGQTYSFGSGSLDAFLIKTDSVGNEEWSKAYGGPGDDFFFNAIQTFDGGYIAVGATTSFGAGDYDMLIIRTNASGDTLWTRILGGVSYDQMEDVIQTADSNFVLCGRTESFGLAIEESFLCKINQSGDTLWTLIFGGSVQQEAIYLAQTYDRGYIVTGSSNSFSTSFDAYLNRFDSAGHLLWSKLYGGPLTDATYNVVIMSDSGFTLLGFTNSFGPPLSIKHNGNSNPYARTEGDDSSNIYIIRTNVSGDTLWTSEYGGRLQDEAYGLLKTSDDGLVILGYSSSFGTDSTDAYLIKTDAKGHSDCNEKPTNPAVASPNTIVSSAATQITSGVSVVAAPFSQFAPPTFAYVLCSALGVSDAEVSSKDLTLYPNPAANQLTISIPSLQRNEPGTIFITNILWQALYQSVITNPKSEIDISFLTAGIYFVHLNDEKGMWTGRFVKE